MAKTKKRVSSNDFLYVKPPQAEVFEHMNTPFGKNVEQQIENPGEWSAREETLQHNFGRAPEWTRLDDEGSDANRHDTDLTKTGRRRKGGY